MKRVAIAVVVVWINMLAFWFLISKVQRLARERERLGYNVEALMTENQRYRLDSTTMVNETEGLRLTVEELRRYREEDARLIKRLEVKNRQLEAISKQAVKVEARFEAPVKDTVIVRDSIPVMVRNVRFKDQFVEIEGAILENRLHGFIRLRATLKQVLYHEYRRRFLFFRWGRGKVRQVVVCDNPYVEVDYQEYIEIRRK